MVHGSCSLYDGTVDVGAEQSLYRATAQSFDAYNAQSMITTADSYGEVGGAAAHIPHLILNSDLIDGGSKRWSED